MNITIWHNICYEEGGGMQVRLNETLHHTTHSYLLNPSAHGRRWRDLQMGR